MSEGVINDTTAAGGAGWVGSLHELAASVLAPDHAVLKGLGILRPGRVLTDVARCYGLIILAWMILTLSSSPWMVALPCFLLIGTQQYALAILAHDGRHGRLLPNRRVNEWFTRLVISAPLLHDVHWEAECASHIAHHRTVATPDDPERHLYVAAGKATRRDFLFYLTALPAIPKVIAKIVRGTAGSAVRRRQQAVVTPWVLPVAMQTLIVVATSAFTPLWFYVVFWLGPLYVCVFVPKKIRVLCEHGQPLLPDEAADGHRLITYVPNPFERCLLAPMNMHYHAEHHLWPFVPYYNLPALHRLIGAVPAIEVRSSYIGFLRKYFACLPLTPGAHFAHGGNGRRGIAVGSRNASPDRGLSR